MSSLNRINLHLHVLHSSCTFAVYEKVLDTGDNKFCICPLNQYFSLILIRIMNLIFLNSCMKQNLA